MSDYIIIALLTLAVYYPLRWGAGGDDVHRGGAADRPTGGWGWCC